MEAGRFDDFTLRGEPYFNKGPLRIGMTHALARVFGLDAWTHRIPSAVMGLVCVALVWALGRRFDLEIEAAYRNYDYPNAFAFHEPAAGPKTLETLDAEPRQRTFDDARHIGAIDAGEIVAVGHQLGVNLDMLSRGRRQVFQIVSQQLLDTGVDICAVEGREAAGDELVETGKHLLALQWRASVPFGKLPGTGDRT